MEIKRVPAGVYAANCYIVFSNDTKKGIVVDPGGDADDILAIIKDSDLDIEYIVLTHGHGDHIGGVNEIKNSLNVPVLAHSGDLDLLVDGSKNYSSLMTFGTVELRPDKLVNDGDFIEFGELKAKVIHTPGHTRGGICLLIDNYLFTGDTLFQRSIGRTDLVGGDYDTLIESIKNKLLVLPDETIVLPGHGPQTSIKRERNSNPFLR